MLRKRNSGIQLNLRKLGWCDRRFTQHEILNLRTRNDHVKKAY